MGVLWAGESSYMEAVLGNCEKISLIMLMSTAHEHNIDPIAAAVVCLASFALYLRRALSGDGSASLHAAMLKVRKTPWEGCSRQLHVPWTPSVPSIIVRLPSCACFGVVGRTSI